MSSTVPVDKLESLFATIPDVDGQSRKVHYIDLGRQDSQLPPLVIIGGTAQTIGTFGPHIRPISRKRRLVIIELRCQGKTELLSSYGTIDQHVVDFQRILENIGINSCHLAGFSFGGRVSLAIASKYPELVQKLSITGVPLHRPVLGRQILQSWKEGLQHGEMHSCAWSFVLNGYSEKFLTEYVVRLPQFVDMIKKANDPMKLYHLMKHSHIDDPDHYYSVPSCCSRIQCPTQVIGSTEDRIAGHLEVAELSKHIKHGEFYSLPGGHLVPFESPLAWRNMILEYLR